MEYNLNLTTTQTVLFATAIVWDLVWTGAALWQAGRRNHPRWFIALLLLNTVGVLPMVYFWLHRERKTHVSFDARPAHSH